MNAVVILHATGRAVGAVVAAAKENWLQHGTLLAPGGGKKNTHTHIFFSFRVTLYPLCQSFLHSLIHSYIRFLFRKPFSQILLSISHHRACGYNQFFLFFSCYGHTKYAVTVYIFSNITRRADFAKPVET